MSSIKVKGNWVRILAEKAFPQKTALEIVQDNETISLGFWKSRIELFQLNK